MSLPDYPHDPASVGDNAPTEPTPWKPRFLTDEQTPDWVRPILRALREGQLEQDQLEQARLEQGRLEQDRKAALFADEPVDHKSID